MTKELAIKILIGDVLGTNEQTHEAVKMAIKALVAEPTRHGEWIERKVITDNDAIKEWQSAKCSKCGKYHTTPYMYYFSGYDYCPHCGARMYKEEL